LGSKKDLVLGVDGARELVDGIPNASYYEFSKLGHAPLSKVNNLIK
jgi:putative hydrolase